MRLYLGTLLSLILILSGCTLPGTVSEGSQQEGLIEFEGSGFAMQIPSNWNTTPEKTIQTPRDGEVLMRAISPEVRYGFSNNIIVMRDSLDAPLTSKKYSELNQIQTAKNYLEYTKVSDSGILFGDDDESRITIFEAKYNTTTPRMKFIQTAKVCGTTVYLIHATVSLDKNTDNYTDLFKTFSCN